MSTDLSYRSQDNYYVNAVFEYATTGHICELT